jgi:hypothetical protein
MTTLPVATILPFEARLMLQRAASVEPSKANPLARQIAIEEATARLRMLYPQFFRSEEWPL